MGLPITTSPDITLLNFTILYDISGATPTITLTNASTGPNLNLCTWWYVIMQPSGLAIHEGSETSPDVSNNNWNTITVPDTWPTPFGTYPGGGQIEFSCSGAYQATLYVMDSDENIFSFTIAQTICRPNGNTDLTLGNFGGADIDVKVRCQIPDIFASDKTNYAYQTLTGTPQSQKWTLVYPMDANGNLPDPVEVLNAAYALFSISYSGEGYNIYLNTFSTYVFSNGASIKVQYKSQSNPKQRTSFAVWCNINLCNLASEFQKLYDVAKRSCGQVEYPEIMNKISQIGLLFNQVLIGIEQPMCGIDVPAKIKEIEKVGGFNCNCCGSAGVNYGNALPIPSSTGGCCPVTTPIWLYGTTANPPNCQTGSYFPAPVYAPDGETYIGFAYSANDIVSLMNANGAWSALGVALNMGNCQVGFIKANSGTTVPPVIVGLGIGTGYGAGDTPPCVDGDQYYLAVITDKCSGNPTLTLPTNITIKYSSSGDEIDLGFIATMGDLLDALNSEGDKPASFSYSIGLLAGRLSILVHNNNCPATSGLLYIYGANDCGGGGSGSVIVVDVIDKDTDVPPALCPRSYFPCYLYEPDGTTLIGNVNNITELIDTINASSAWQIYGTSTFNGSLCTVTFINNNTGTIPDIIIEISDTCTGGTINVAVSVTDPCGSSYGFLSPTTFPATAYVNWNDGSGNHTLGTVTSKADLIAKLNADGDKPASVTVADNVYMASQIILNESDCTYTDIPEITINVTSGTFVILGPNCGSLLPVSPLPSNELAYRGDTLDYLGAFSTASPDETRFHSIRVGNFLVDNGSDTGKIRFFDVTNPRTPTLITTLQLNNEVVGNFTGVPESVFAATPPIGPVLSRQALYFPTDANSYMNIEELYVVETNTGTIWKFGMTAGVLDSFQSNTLRGKCPRVITNGKLFFTQDGDMELYAGASGVDPGDIVILDLSDFSATGLSTETIFEDELQSVWTASFDGMDTIYFVGTDVNIIGAAGTSVAKYTVSTSAVTRYLNIGPTPAGYFYKRANSAFFAGKLHVAALNDVTTNCLYFFDVSTLGTTNDFTVYAPFLPTQFPMTITVVGNCYILVTFTEGNLTGENYLLKYAISSVTALVNIVTIKQLGDTQLLFNVIPFLVPSIFPNSFV